MSRDTKKLLLDLELPLAERLKAVAEEIGATQLGIIRVALTTYLRQLDPTESEHFVVKLPEPTAETFAAFREIRKYPDRTKLIESALLDHIDQECEHDVSLRPRIEEVKSVQSRKRIHEVKEASIKGD